MRAISSTNQALARIRLSVERLGKKVLSPELPQGFVLHRGRAGRLGHLDDQLDWPIIAARTVDVQMPISLSAQG